ncbi:MAG: BON domain-containing protein [Gammaproteobacteria bacterium]|nr:BON domain-containing protein [Gammaproteobacteria bacterium]
MSRDRSAVSLHTVGILVFGASVLLVIASGLSWYHTVKLEQQLRVAVSERLAAEGFEDVEFALDGRVVTLTGTVEAGLDRQRMVEIAAAVEGVAEVFDERTVTDYASGRAFRLHSYAGITTVEGELPEQRDIELVHAAIRASFGVDPLGADLDVHRAVRRPPWLDDLEAILDAVGVVSPLKIEASDDTLVVSGDVADEATVERVERRLKSIVGDAPLDLFLRLPGQIREPVLRIEYRRGRLTLEGTVPADDFANELVDTLSLAFAVDDIENNLEIDPDVRHSSWLEGVLRVVFPLAMTSWFDLEVKPGEVVVRGSVRDEAEREILDTQIRENFDYTRRVVNLIRSRPEPG